jgi:multidrug efflux pump subunit AcrB
VSVDIDRDKAAALGVTANQIESALYDAYPVGLDDLRVGQRVQSAAAR